MNLKEYILNHGTMIDFAKNEYVFRQGSDNKNLYYVETGLLKAYYVSYEGKETIKSFMRKGNMIGSIAAVNSGSSCTFSLKTIQVSRLISIPYDSVMNVVKESHPISIELVSYLLNLSQKKEQREFDFLNLDAEARYRKFCDQNADIKEFISQGDVARYLGITPVALSRIKKRIF